MLFLLWEAEWAIVWAEGRGIAGESFLRKWAMVGFFKRFLDARAAASAKKVELGKKFDDFVKETTNKNFQYDHRSSSCDHKDYRLVWRRAVILARYYGEAENIELKQLNDEFARTAKEHYYLRAPDTLYGKPPLKFGDRICKQMVETELRRLHPEEFEKPRARPLACIYMGKCDRGRVYVGQTVGAPELRWVQHRMAGTGPFKDGEKYVAWTVIEKEVHPGKLNEREAYYIGFYNADHDGYNDTAGNDRAAYSRGERDRANSSTSTS
jgi:hypothetical protein